MPTKLQVCTRVFFFVCEWMGGDIRMCTSCKLEANVDAIMYTIRDNEALNYVLRDAHKSLLLQCPAAKVRTAEPLPSYFYFSKLPTPRGCMPDSFHSFVAMTERFILRDPNLEIEFVLWMCFCALVWKHLYVLVSYSHM